MNQTHKVNGFSLLIFALFFNYIFYNYFLTPSLINNFGGTAFIVYLLALPAVVILFFVLPKRIEKNYFLVIDRNPFVRYSLAFYTIFKALLIIVVGSFILVENFYFNQNVLYFIFGFMLIAVIISKLHLNSIINMSTIVFILVIPFILFSFLFLPTISPSNILPISFKPKDNSYLLFFFVGIVDTMGMFQANNTTKTTITRKWLCLGIVVSFILLSVETYFLTVASSLAYFKDYHWIGFTIYRIQKFYEYVGNFDFIYIYIVSVSVILKCGYYLCSIRILLHIKKTKLSFSIFNVLMFSLVIVFYLFRYELGVAKDYIRYVLLSFALFFYVFLLRRLKNELRT